MTVGSPLQRRYLALRDDRRTRAEACAATGMRIAEAKLIDAELAVPKVPHLFDLLDAPVVSRAFIFRADDAAETGR